MFAPSINVDLEKLQQESEEKPAAAKKVASRGRQRARKATPKTDEKD